MDARALNIMDIVHAEYHYQRTIGGNMSRTANAHDFSGACVKQKIKHFAGQGIDITADNLKNATGLLRWSAQAANILCGKRARRLFVK